MPTFSFPSIYYKIFIFLLFCVSFIGLFIPIMEVDATQYANMSLELLRSNSLIQFTDLGENYLDKPPLLFWMSALSIAIFGNTTWAFKLPSFFMAWFSVYFLYRFAKIYYSESIAKLSALLYSGSVAFILFTNDIRTDTLMISFVVLAIWQLALYIESNKTKHLLIASIALGLSMLAKGPIGLVVPVLAIAPHILLTGRWKPFLKWQIILTPIIIFIVLSPMLIGLHQQFGWHGIRFYFWEQSFGRITGENVWKNDATYFYFLHNIAWAFIPFILFLIGGLLFKIKYFKSQKEYISLFGFLLPFIALSLSHYKLPHYIYVCIPFAAIISAQFLYYWLTKHKNKLDSIIIIFQSIITLALICLPIALFLAFPASFYLYIIYISTLLLLSYLLYKQQNSSQLFHITIIAFILASFILNIHAYPSLLKYQSSSEAAFYIHQNEIEKENVYQLNIWNRAFHYYMGKQIPEINVKNLKNNSNIYIFTDVKGKEFINKNFQTTIVKEFNDFSVTRLSLNFLNPSTRNQTLKKTYLLKIKNTP